MTVKKHKYGIFIKTTWTGGGENPKDTDIQLGAYLSMAPSDAIK